VRRDLGDGCSFFVAHAAIRAAQPSPTRPFVAIDHADTREEHSAEHHRLLLQSAG
jgi:hypothetical protein